MSVNEMLSKTKKASHIEKIIVLLCERYCQELNTARERESKIQRDVLPIERERYRSDVTTHSNDLSHIS